MLGVEILDRSRVDQAAEAVRRDGVVAILDVIDAEQLDRLRAGVDRVVEHQMAQMPPEQANRGAYRYSLPDTIDEPEWAELIDEPVALEVLEAVWGSDRFTCCDGGGDYSLPGADMQPLHSDLRDFFYDPHGAVSARDVPPPFIVVNYVLDDFVPENGPTRFVPATQRSRNPIPTLEEEPEFMRTALLCAPAGTAVIRDTRTWHGGTPNNLARRVMVGMGYFAPWFRGALEGAGRITKTPLSLERYRMLSPRARRLVAHLVNHEHAA